MVAHLQLLGLAFLVLVRALIPHKLNELQQEAELTLASLAQCWPCPPPFPVLTS